jgi:hypothetical protein
MGFFKKRLHLTYTKENLYTGEIYSGRASGLVTDEDINEGVARSILSKRDSSHHKNEDGFDRAQIDLNSENSDAVRGREQARLYANGLERDFGQRPIVFYSNGYETGLWDDKNYPPRNVFGLMEKWTETIGFME